MELVSIYASTYTQRTSINNSHQLEPNQPRHKPIRFRVAFNYVGRVERRWRRRDVLMNYRLTKCIIMIKETNEFGKRTCVIQVFWQVWLVFSEAERSMLYKLSRFMRVFFLARSLFILREDDVISYFNRHMVVHVQIFTLRDQFWRYAWIQRKKK